MFKVNCVEKEKYIHVECAKYFLSSSMSVTTNMKFGTAGGCRQIYRYAVKLF
jgi:hypothetical protein